MTEHPAPSEPSTDAELRALAEKAILLKKAREAGGWDKARVPDTEVMGAIHAASEFERMAKEIETPQTILGLLDLIASLRAEVERLAGALHFCPTCDETCKDCLCTEKRESDLRTEVERLQEQVRGQAIDYPSIRANAKPADDKAIDYWLNGTPGPSRGTLAFTVRELALRAKDLRSRLALAMRVVEAARAFGTAEKASLDVGPSDHAAVLRVFEARAELRAALDAGTMPE